jgi:hypothetical protein
LRGAGTYVIVFAFSGQPIAQGTGRSPVRKVPIYVGQGRDRIGRRAGDYLPVVRIGVDDARAAECRAHQPSHQ